MKYLLLSFCLLSFSLSSSASTNIDVAHGPYVGAEVVGGQFETIPGAAFNSSLVSVSLYIKPIVGYRFNNYFALEGGYNNLVNDDNKGNLNPPPGGFRVGPDHYRLYTVNVAGKFIYPFESGFSLFAKAGFAYAHQDVYNETYFFNNMKVISADNHSNGVLPLIGVGASYNFTPQVNAELNATHLDGNNGIGNINTIGLGVSYTFSF